MKYVSCCWASEAETACITPLIPPIRNIAINPKENSIGVLSLIDPPHIVANQLNTFIPVGTAISIVVIVNIAFTAGPMPTVNMWWLHTIQPINAMIAPASTIVAYPNKGFLEKTGNTSDTIPIAGNMRM